MPDGNFLAPVASKGEAKLALSNHRDIIAGFAHAAGKEHWLVSVGADGAALLWGRDSALSALSETPSRNWYKGRFEQKLAGEEGTVLTSVDLSEDGSIAIMGGTKGLVQLWLRGAQNMRYDEGIALRGMHSRDGIRLQLAVT